MNLTIDGSVHEGGGSIIRVAVPIATAMGKTIQIVNIRQNRRKPGLRLQHLLGLQILRDISNGILTGDEVGSTRIVFKPGENGKRLLNISVSTAASIPLIIQTLINYIATGGAPVKIFFNGGGTHTQWAPTMEYLEYVTAPNLAKFGIHLEISIHKLGFYPQGGANVEVRLYKREIDSPVIIPNPRNSKHKPINSKLYVSCSKNLQDKNIPERIHNVVKKKVNAKLVINYKEGTPGVAATLVIPRDPIRGYSVIGERRLSSEKLGLMIVQQIKEEPIDQHLSDQLLVPLAFAPEGSSILVHNTPHVLANLHVIKTICGDVLRVKNEGAFLHISNIHGKK